MASKLYMPDGSSRVVTPANGVHWTLEELQGFVGGYIEVVRTTDLKFMVVNEEGKLPHLNLPYNRAATELNSRLDAIVGPAVVVDTLLEMDGPDDEN